MTFEITTDLIFLAIIVVYGLLGAKKGCIKSVGGLIAMALSWLVFPTDDSLLKMLYLATMDITRKWTGRRRDWGEIHSQLEIFLGDRISY